MKLIKRELLLCMSLTAFVFVCALAWGSPFLAIGSGSSAVRAQEQAAVHLAQFNGSVLRGGDGYLLRDSSGQLFGLDGAQPVQSFEGKAVTVTGTLDGAGKIIRVQSIAAAF